MSDAPTQSHLPAPGTASHTPGSGTLSAPPEGDGTLSHSSARSADRADVPVIPGYEILGELGQGGMGVVYRAREIAFDRDVAIKLLHARYRPDSPGTRRFLEEARITGQLQHPAIPPVHQIGTLGDGRPFLAMKLIKGDTLADLLETEPQNRGRFVAVFAQVCQALAYAHSRKVIHRDLKPANVMVGSFGEVQVMDWGLAKLLASRERERPEATEVEDERTEIRTTREADGATQAGSVLGTPAYMAPEQAQGAVEEIDERSDVFGLGAMLCAILTGKPPYSGPSTDSIRLKAIRGETADALARLDACGFDPELIALCKRCLAIDRMARPRDAGEVAKAVTDHLAAVEERARQAELDRVRSEEQRKRRRVQFVLAGAGVALLVLVAFGLGLASLWRDAEAAKIQLAGANGRLAETNTQLAAEKDQTEAARAEAEAARERLAAVEYGRTMQVAYREWLDNNAGATAALLASTRPDLRGWEYRYLYGLCNSHLLTLKGHTKEVYSAAFSPDGSRVVTASSDQTARVWDATTGAELFTLKAGGRPFKLGGSTFTRDGTKVVGFGETGGAKVWDAKDGSEILNWKLGKGEGPAVFALAFNPDGFKLIASTRDGRFQILDAKSGAELITLAGIAKRSGDNEIMTTFAFSRDGSKVVAGGKLDSDPDLDGIIRIWDTRSGQILLSLKEQVFNVESVAFSPDGSRLLVAGSGWFSGDGTARVLDAKTGAELLALNGHKRAVNSAKYSADGSRVVTSGRDGTARIWDAKTGLELLRLKGHASSINDASFNPDGTRVVTASTDGTVKIWDAQTGSEIPPLKGSVGEVQWAKFSPDGSRVVSVGGRGTVRVWDAESGKELSAWVMEKAAGKAKRYFREFSPDGLHVVTSDEEGTFQVSNALTGANVLVLQGKNEPLFHDMVAYNPSRTRIATVSFLASDNSKRLPEPRIQVWDTKNGNTLLTFTSPHLLYSVSFSPEGSRLLTTGDVIDSKVGPSASVAQVWDAHTGAEILAIKLPAAETRASTFSPDRSKIVTAGETINVWDAKSGTELLNFKAHLNRVHAVAFSLDGSRLFTGCEDGAVRIWDAKTGVELMTLKGHTSSIWTVAVSPNGDRIVTGSLDGTSRIWGVRRVTGAAHPPAAIAPAPREVKP